MNGAWTADNTMTLKLLRCDKGTVVLHSVPGAHEMCVGVFWVQGKHEDVCDLCHLSEQMSVCLRQQASQSAKSSVQGLCRVSGPHTFGTPFSQVIFPFEMFHNKKVK